MELGKKISQTIFEFIQTENRLLITNHGKGIFDLPELALVYEVSKGLALKFEYFFGTQHYEWKREHSLGNGGPTDLALLNISDNELGCALEFKMDDTWMKYYRDIIKLHSLEKKKFNKYFVSLKWVNSEGQGKVFLKQLNLKFNEGETKADLADTKTFSTIVSNSTDEFCLYTFWKVF